MSQIVVIEADSAAAASKELMRGDVIRAVNDVTTRDKTIDEVTLPNRSNRSRHRVWRGSSLETECGEGPPSTVDLPPQSTSLQIRATKRRALDTLPTV